MKTPIVDFVKKYSESGFSRLHMPGHKGKNILSFEQLDITEIKNADALYEAEGIIAESEKNASEIFNSGKTLYSTEGSTQCIKAMLYLVKLLCKEEKCTVLASRNSHKALIYGCALLSIDIEWLFGEDEKFSLCRCVITPETLRNALKNSCGKIAAVYVTSPDYLGGELDLADLADAAHEFGVPLIVDNAHGAYLHFLEKPCHPLDLGADMCCDSAHKTLPVLTGGAYLHIAGNAPKVFSDNAKRAMELFGSTSPSYLILQSIDAVNGYLCDGYNEKLKACIEKINNLKSKLTENGYTVLKSDPLKLTLQSSGVNLAEILRKYSVECEYEDPDYTVMMFTPENMNEDFERIEKALMKEKIICHKMNSLTMIAPKRAMSVRAAIFSESEEIPIEKSVGRTAALPSVSCPPAVPVVVSGEVILEEHIKIFDYYGIKKISVIK